MKKFIYCESTEGGMDSCCFNKIKELGLYAWMSDEFCKKEDQALCDWLEKAEVGQYFEHRLGICFRVSDIQI